ncbi:hypothetical protein [Desulfurobacterium atlanticum]|uniref:Uncharacterized protein n=1 Tax=Desulfurobacterium atlanticum TaxID=240169 RepID=A0A238YS49_9BACT|nr:hypothetical protein [Desulfurobacterium atlanticum]SNR73648.1 hypothetical protein SAMN06265340_104130 [Desulfurobacterium atlanticum]
MIEIHVVCDRCGEREVVKVSGTKVIAAHPFDIRPDSWKLLHKNGKLLFLCENCCLEDTGEEKTDDKSG